MLFLPPPAASRRLGSGLWLRDFGLGWVVGLLGNCVVGLLVCWFVGLLDCCVVELKVSGLGFLV